MVQNFLLFHGGWIRFVRRHWKASTCTKMLQSQRSTEYSDNEWKIVRDFSLFLSFSHSLPSNYNNIYNICRSFRIRNLQTKTKEKSTQKILWTWFHCTNRNASHCNHIWTHLFSFFVLRWFSWAFAERCVRCALTSWNRPKTIKNRIKSTKITHAVRSSRSYIM